MERAADRFATKLLPHFGAVFHELDSETRAAVAALYGDITGLRFVRGEIGAAWRSDPLGTHRPSAYDRVQLPPDHERPTPSQFFEAWLTRERTSGS